MAGNIIPAIATTNAIISGVIVMQALNILNGKLAKCKTVSCILDIMNIDKQLLGSSDEIPGWTHVFTVVVNKYIGRLTKATVAKPLHENRHLRWRKRLFWLLGDYSFMLAFYIVDKVFYKW